MLPRFSIRSSICGGAEKNGRARVKRYAREVLVGTDGEFRELYGARLFGKE